MKIILLFTAMLALFRTNIYPQFEFRERGEDINIQQTLINMPLGNIGEAKLDSLITSIMKTEHIPGTQALIVKHDEIVWNKNYGYANIGQNKPVDDSTLFMIGSISKTFVSTAIMQLWEDGLVDLDDNINDYLLPDFQVINPTHPNDTITVFMLMTHTSSIRDNWNILQPLRDCGDSPIPLDTFFIKYFTPGGIYYSSNNFNSWAPGTYGQYDYTNAGAGLLAYIVEKISGISFDQYCRQNIFDPLDMDSTTTSWFLEGLDTNRIATPYDWQGGQFIPDCHRGFPVYPIGDLMTTKLDLEHFLSAFMNWGEYNGNRILDSATVDMILTDHLGYTPHSQGFLWYQTTELNERWVWGHFGGWIPGVTTAMFFHPDEDWGFIVFINFYLINPFDNICNYIMDYAQLYGHIYALYPKVNKPYLIPSVDTLTITTYFSNINQHNFTANAIYISSDSTLIDSVALYDDGLHGDSLANDGLWGGFIYDISEENFFSVGISTTDLQTGEYFFTGEQTKFTTAGPIVFNSYYLGVDTIPGAGDYTAMKVLLENTGNTMTVENVSAYLYSLDTSLAVVTTTSQPNYGNLEPGEIDETQGGYGIQISSNVTHGMQIRFGLEIRSNDYTYWVDTTSIFIVTSANLSSNDIPTEYKLKQNYPNPFNPTTMIRYAIPERSFVELKVFDILGREVASLVNEEQDAGYYEFIFNAVKLSSGIYFYRIKAEDFVQTKKMILIK